MAPSRKFRLGHSLEIIFELVFNQFNPIFGEVRIRPLSAPDGGTKCISGLRGIPGVTLKLAAAGCYGLLVESGWELHHRNVSISRGDWPLSTRRKSCVLCGLEFKQSSVGVIRKGMVINSSNCCGVIFGSAALGCECERSRSRLSRLLSLLPHCRRNAVKDRRGCGSPRPIPSALSVLSVHFMAFRHL